MFRTERRSAKPRRPATDTTIARENKFESAVEESKQHKTADGLTHPSRTHSGGRRSRVRVGKARSQRGCEEPRNASFPRLPAEIMANLRPAYLLNAGRASRPAACHKSRPPHPHNNAGCVFRVSFARRSCVSSRKVVETSWPEEVILVFRVFGSGSLPGSTEI